MLVEYFIILQFFSTMCSTFFFFSFNYTISIFFFCWSIWDFIFLFWSLNNEWLNSLTWYFLNGVFYHQQNGDYTRRILVPTVASAPPSVGRQVVMHPGVKRFDPPLLILCKLWLIECWHFLTKKISWAINVWTVMNIEWKWIVGLGERSWNVHMKKI